MSAQSVGPTRGIQLQSIGERLRPCGQSRGSFQPSPDRTQAISLNSPLDLSCVDSARRYQLDGEHAPTELAVGVRIPPGAQDLRKSDTYGRVPC
jgi:hypothetical protein